MRKLLIDAASQAFPFIANLIERVVLTAILLRAWNLDGFEYWSLAIAATGFLALFDAGCLFNFSNRMTEALVHGDERLGVAIFRQSNSVFVALGALATLASAGVAFNRDIQQMFGLDPGVFASQASHILFALGAASGVRLAYTNIFSVYRAKRELARGTTLLAGVELARLAAVGLVVLLGASLAEAAWTHLALMAAGQLAIASLDIARRWPAYRFRTASPWDGALRGSWSTSLLYSLPTIPAAAINHAPVLILGGVAGLGAGLVGQFVLLRTLANFVRKTLFMVLNVIAMDLARHGMASGETRARALMAPVAALSAVAAGIFGGAVMSYGGPFIAIWAARGDIYDPWVLGVMLAPMVLTPTFIFSQAYLQLRNRPWVWTVGSFAHLAIALLLFWALKDVAVVLRLTIAIFAGEIIGLALPVLWAAQGYSAVKAVRQCLAGCALSLASCAAVVVASTILSRVIIPQGFRGLAMHGLVLGAIFGAVLLWAVKSQLERARRIIDAEHQL